MNTTEGTGPRALALELTKGCNLRCSYCYYADREDAYQPSKRMSADVARQSIDLLVDDGPPGEPVHIHFFGGEPLLAFDELRSTVQYGVARAEAAGKRITFEVTTNGTRLSEEVVAFLNEHAIHVGVSFDGPPEIQDEARPAGGTKSSYQMALPGIRRLLESRRGTPLAGKTHCSAVLTRDNLDWLDITGHLEELGFEKIIVTPATDLAGRDNGVQDGDLDEVFAGLDALARDTEERMARGESVPTTWFPRLIGRVQSGERRTQFCEGGRDYLGVTADGDLHLCYRFFEDDDHAMGSVQEGVDRGVTERLEARDLDSRTVCSQCWARYYCGGGCHHENVQSSGTLEGPNPVNCEIFRHSMGQAIEMWARLSRSGSISSASAPPMNAETDPNTSPTPGTSNGASNPATPMADDHRPRRAEGCHTRELDGEQIVYDPKTHNVVVLNATAAFILDHCDGERTVTDLLDALAGEFDAPRELLQADLRATLADLHERQLVS